MEGLLVMSGKERERLKIFFRVKRGELRLKKRRPCVAWIIAICDDCVSAIANKAIAVWCIKAVGEHRTGPDRPEFKAAVLARHQERYWDFGPTHWRRRS